MQLSKELFVKLQESVSFFSSFSAGELLALLKLAVSESFDDREIIFKENTRGDKMYIILSGNVKISKNIGRKREEVLVILEPGACFGEMGVIDQSPRSATATVDGGAAVMLVIKESTLSERNVLLAYKLYKNFALMLAKRMRETNDKLQSTSMNYQDAQGQLKDILKKKTAAGQSLEGANLKGADFSDAFLNNANLKDAMLMNASLDGTRCKQTNLTGAKLVNANIKSVTFEQGNFKTADFAGAHFDDVTFNGCNMSHCDFRGAELPEAIAEKITLTGAVKSGTPTKKKK